MSNSEFADGGKRSDPWQALRHLTRARIGQGHTGVSLPTRHWLDFQLAHARAQDAVHIPLDVGQLLKALQPLTEAPPLVLHSQAVDRLAYLQRPDLGRQLDSASQQQLSAASQECDLAIVIADGLSAQAIQRHGAPFLHALLPLLEASLAPLCLVRQGRVAIGDQIGQLLNAQAVLVMIGERPGLTSPDSLGLYLTWAPAPGTTDERRNCISNIHGAGLDYASAAARLVLLLAEARCRRLSGVELKDQHQDEILAHGPGNFLLGSEPDPP